MRILVLSVLLSCLLSGCASKARQEIPLFNDLGFQLLAGEKSARVDSRKEHSYASLTSSSSIQIPLFKCIEGSGYTIYLGIPVNTSIPQLARQRGKEIPNPLISASDTSTYSYLRHQQDTLLLTEFTRRMDANIFYVLAVCQSPSMADSLFSLEALLGRINSM